MNSCEVVHRHVLAHDDDGRALRRPAPAARSRSQHCRAGVCRASGFAHGTRPCPSPSYSRRAVPARRAASRSCRRRRRHFRSRSGPRISPMRWPTSRPTTSVGPPAVNGMIIVIGRVGKFCAGATATPIAAKATAAVMKLSFLSIASSAAAHDPEKLQTFRTKIMRKIRPHPSSSTVRDGCAKRTERETIQAERIPHRRKLGEPCRSGQAAISVLLAPAA